MRVQPTGLVFAGSYTCPRNDGTMYVLGSLPDAMVMHAIRASSWGQCHQILHNHPAFICGPTVHLHSKFSEQEFLSFLFLPTPPPLSLSLSLSLSFCLFHFIFFYFVIQQMFFTNNSHWEIFEKEKSYRRKKRQLRKSSAKSAKLSSAQVTTRRRFCQFSTNWPTAVVVRLQSGRI